MSNNPDNNSPKTRKNIKKNEFHYKTKKSISHFKDTNNNNLLKYRINRMRNYSIYQIKTDNIQQIKKGLEKQYMPVENRIENDNEFSELRNNIDGLGNKISVLGNEISDLKNDLGIKISELGNKISDLKNDFGNKISDLKNDLGNKISELGNTINNGFSGLQTNLSQLFSQYFGGKEYGLNSQNNSPSDTQKEIRSNRYPSTDEIDKNDIDLLSYSKSNKSDQPKKRIYTLNSEIFSRGPKAEREKKNNEKSSKISGGGVKFFDKNETISSLRRKYQNQAKKKNE